MILAGGRGKRLRPATDYLPKPLVPINNVPLIEWQIRYLQKFAIRDVIVCSGYRTEMIQDYLGVKKDLLGHIQFSIEKNPLGTGGAIKKAARLIDDESFVVINGDIITDIDLDKLTSVQNSIASVPLRTKFGVIDAAQDDTITRFREKAHIQDLWMNAGIYHLQRSAVRGLPAKGNIEQTLFPHYADMGRLRMVRFADAMWHSVDSFKDIQEGALDVEKMVK